MRHVLIVAARHEGVGGGAAVGVLICDDETMRDYNHRFAGEDGTTDVLAFVAKERGRGGESLPLGAGTRDELGDIIISLDRVRAQAAVAGHTEEREAAILAVHGFLHLLGYDHHTRGAARAMFRKQDTIVEEAGL